MKNKNCERQLPQGYKQVYYIDATNKKTGLILNLAAIVVLAVIMLIASIPLFLNGGFAFELKPLETLILLAVVLAVLFVYIILHELVHGIAYKSLTGEKLTFGLSWSCAFCGVPNVYTYKKAAIIALISPLTVFALIFIPLTVVLYFVHPAYYLASAFILGMHVGGCCGDIYVLLLILCKFKSDKLLMKDTGPEQYFYLPETEN